MYRYSKTQRSSYSFAAYYALNPIDIVLRVNVTRLHESKCNVASACEVLVLFCLFIFCLICFYKYCSVYFKNIFSLNNIFSIGVRSRLSIRNSRLRCLNVVEIIYYSYKTKISVANKTETVYIILYTYIYYCQ